MLASKTALLSFTLIPAQTKSEAEHTLRPTMPCGGLCMLSLHLRYVTPVSVADASQIYVQSRT